MAVLKEMEKKMQKEDACLVRVKRNKKGCKMICSVIFSVAGLDEN